jgi:EAL domain-containing protein (putative c-di-GMP-specific phosphodiesterase class I)
MPPPGTTLVYQPIVDLHSGRTVRLEALLRLPGPVDEVPPTREFLQTLDDDELTRLGHWVCRRALADLEDLRHQWDSDMRMSYNVDPREITTADWASEVIDCIESANLRPMHVTLELTEGEACTTDAALTALRHLSNAGVAIALDGVGTGLNALGLLQTLPVSEFKIDRQFVGDLSRTSTSGAILRGLIGVAHELAITVVAEGIDSEERLDLLREMGVDHGQGHLFGRSTELSAVASLVTDGDPQAAAVDLIRLMFLGGATPATIAAALNSQGYRGPKGRRWHRESVARVTKQFRPPMSGG